ncbi:Ribonuclease H domain [Sesbania bispinosa]|nr:Ribonuclease H domain [Sesbania bispinosa]
MTILSNFWVPRECSFWLLGFSAFLGPGTAFEAELWAICEGLALAWNHGYRHIIVESDVAEVVTQILQGVPSPHHMFRNLILEIWRFLKRSWRVFNTHIPREANGTADCLAKIGTHQDSRIHVWSFPPPEVATHLLRDDRVRCCLGPLFFLYSFQCTKKK